MKIFTFHCSNKPDLFAVTQEPSGNNLPKNICTGEWVRHGETEAQRGDAIAGFVTGDLFRDLDRQGFHLASGVRVAINATAPRPVASASSVQVSGALASANVHTRFFPTDTDA